MKKSKLVLLMSAVVIFAAAVGFVVNKEESQSFQSVELGLAEVSPLGEAGGYAVPASGNSVEIYVPKAKINDTKNPTYWEEEFKIWFGPKNDNQDSDICELYRKGPNSNNWDRIETAGAGNVKSKTQTLSPFGTWDYRTRCGIEVNTCTPTLYETNSHTRIDKLLNIAYGNGDSVLDGLIGLNIKTDIAEANGGGGSGCKNVTYWGPWEYLNHKVVPRPPRAEISQNKAVTIRNENFRITYGPKTTGNTGGNADTCKLQRRNPNQSEWVDQDTNNGNTSNVQVSPGILGTWRYRAMCSNEGGNSEWVKLEHLVVDNDNEPTATIEVRNITQDTGWTSESIVIAVGDQVELRWESTSVTNCSGSAFSTGGATSGSTNDVAEPAASSSKTFGINCTGNHGNASDSLSVTAAGGGVGEVTVDPPIVRPGDVTTVIWKDSPTTCTLTGPGLNMTSLPDPDGSVEVTVNGESTYTLTCPGGTDTATVRVLPVIQET